MEELSADEVRRLGRRGGHLERITWQLFGALDGDDFALVVSGFRDCGGSGDGIFKNNEI